MLTFNKIGVKNLLYNINEVEFSRLLNEVEKHKDYIDKLSSTNPYAANIAVTKLWVQMNCKENF